MIGPTPTGHARRTPARGTVWSCIVLMVLGLFLTACSDGPREVHVGEEECAHCRMLVSEERFASQLITDRGRHYVFDSIECMVEFLDENEEVTEDRIQALWVTDFPDPGAWTPVDQAWFLRSDDLRSPMGLNLSAYARAESAEDARQAFGGEVMRWEDVRELVRRTGVVNGHGHGHSHASPSATGANHHEP